MWTECLGRGVGELGCDVNVLGGATTSFVPTLRLLHLSGPRIVNTETDFFSLFAPVEPTTGEFYDPPSEVREANAYFEREDVYRYGKVPRAFPAAWARFHPASTTSTMSTSSLEALLNGGGVSSSSKDKELLVLASRKTFDAAARAKILAKSARVQRLEKAYNSYHEDELSQPTIASHQRGPARLFSLKTDFPEHRWTSATREFLNKGKMSGILEIHSTIELLQGSDFDDFVLGGWAALWFGRAEELSIAFRRAAFGEKLPDEEDSCLQSRSVAKSVPQKSTSCENSNF